MQVGQTSRICKPFCDEANKEPFALILWGKLEFKHVKFGGVAQWLWHQFKALFKGARNFNGQRAHVVGYHLLLYAAYSPWTKTAMSDTGCSLVFIVHQLIWNILYRATAAVPGHFLVVPLLHNLQADNLRIPQYQRRIDMGPWHSSASAIQTLYQHTGIAWHSVKSILSPKKIIPIVWKLRWYPHPIYTV